MRFKEIIKEGDVVDGPWDKSQGKEPAGTMHHKDGSRVSKPVDMSKAKRISVADAFGGSEYNAIRALGHEFQEKPSEFDGIRKTIDAKDIKGIEHELGGKLNTYQAKDIIGQYKRGAWHPQGDLLKNTLESPDEETFIVWFPEHNKRYLANRTGATKYVRMWAEIV
tara:strand:- start:1697 stop:2194 length:498 start_codon:yes stop_codon:yes gene_type:complete